MNTVVCPHCKKTLEISEAIIHQLQEQVREEESKKIQAEFEKKRAEEAVLQEKKLREEFEEKSKQRTKELEETKQKEKLLEEKLAREREDREKAEAKIKEEAIKEAMDKTRLEKLEYEKKISGMQQKLEEAQRKGKQGSQQLQGDVLELDLEVRLRQAFPYDDFKPVPTGIRGGDIIHEVRNKYGNAAGLILWEAKRQKAWSKGWIIKLKDDMRKINASDCILVTDILPTEIKVYDRIENVWVTSYEYVTKLASVLRFGLMNVAIAKSSASHTDEQLKELYRIITSDSFRNKFEARDEIIATMKKELDSEKSSTERRWKRQEVYIDKLASNNNQLYGELQAHIPSLKPLNTEILELDDGEE